MSSKLNLRIWIGDSSKWFALQVVQQLFSI